MKLLIAQNQELFNKMKLSLEDYKKSEKGSTEITKYMTTCDVKPRNIYTSENNFLERYLFESFIILNSLMFLEEHKIGTVQSVLKEIPEIKHYFSWIEDLFYQLEDIGTVNFPHSNFKDNLVLFVGEYFKAVDKREYGEYYTPDEMIKLSFKYLNLDIKDKVVDPSCGCGFFLLYYLEELSRRGLFNHESDISVLKNNLFGYDIFPFPIIISKLLLGVFLFEQFGFKENLFQFDNIKVHNTVSSLTCKTNKVSNEFDLIIGNPPFFRIEPSDKNEICDCISYGHNYIHNIFLHWSIQHVKDKGKICLFLPQSILSGYYYQKLRAEILEKCNLDLIVSDKNHEKSFLVQQDIMILYLTRSNSMKNSSFFEIGTPNKDFSEIESYRVSISITNNSLRIIPVFKNMEQYQILIDLSQEQIVFTLKDIKLSTGNFVWNQNKQIVLKEYQQGAIPLISGPNVTEDKIKIGEDTKFSYCLPDKEKYIKSENAILYRRMSPIGNEQRMIAKVLDINEIPRYVVENHVNSLTANNWDIMKLKELLSFISSKEFNVLINAYCHTNQVSTNELQTIFETLRSINDTGGNLKEHSYQLEIFETTTI